MNDVTRVTLSKRDSIRSTAALSITKSAVYRNFQHGRIGGHRNLMKSFLKGQALKKVN